MSQPAAHPATSRDRLIAATVAVIARDGMEAASVKAIAAEAGLTPGLLHYHFASKDALIEAALRRALADYLAATAARREALAPHDQIDGLFGAAEVAARDAIDFFKLRLSFAVKALSDPGAAAIWREISAEGVEETARALAKARGRAVPNDRDRTLARTLKACFEGLMLALALDPGFPVDAAAALLRQAVAASDPD